ncbi:MAG: selenocysteine-specific translation elongation factor [Chloroflexota bacterium]|nr:MAG: selenocysteine-specific translation elongation factor [Chloroflexota bacterium]
MFVIGTAGHVDHGKSTLVKALTGIDPDRLREEKERGMTIDLGFAWLKLPSGREISIVDVPGHERFIRNMLAGVGGIDVALLVIAADEGVMPQTTEHLAIVDLLQVHRGLVAVTKVDLVDEEFLELVISDTRDALEGTVLAEAEIVPVSAVTGAGLPDLLRKLDDLLSNVQPKADLGRPRLPIDRVFTIAGFGTVVTGTLIGGTLATGDEVEILPRGVRSRIRGLQTHKKKVAQVGPGNRVAVNLTGLSTTDVERGEVLTKPNWLRPTGAFDGYLRVVKYLSHPVQHNSMVTVHTGSAEVPAKLRLLDAFEIKPGESGWVQLRLEHPVAMVRGDYFILRSPNTTIGGGEVVEPHAKRHRRYHEATLQSLSTMQAGSPAEVLLESLRKIEPCEVKTLLDSSELPTSERLPALRQLLVDEEIVVLGQSDISRDAAPTAFVLSWHVWNALVSRVRELLTTYHQQFPLRRGMPKEEVKSRLKLPQRLFAEVLSRLTAEHAAEDGGSWLGLPGHEVRFSQAQEAIVQRYLRSLKESPYAPPSDNPPETEILNALVEQGEVVRLSENIVFDTRAYNEMVERVVAHLRAHGTVTLGEVRDMFGTSRKYAQALVDHLDERRITRRVGDERVLR